MKKGLELLQNSQENSEQNGNNKFVLINNYLKVNELNSPI